MSHSTNAAHDVTVRPNYEDGARVKALRYLPEIAEDVVQVGTVRGARSIGRGALYDVEWEDGTLETGVPDVHIFERADGQPNHYLIVR